MSFTVDSTGRRALLNVATQGVHLWDLQVIVQQVFVWFSVQVPFSWLAAGSSFRRILLL